MAKTSILSVSELQNPNGLPKALVEAFIADLGRLAEIDREVARRTIRYVVDGTDEDVLLALSGLDPKVSQVCHFTFSIRTASGTLAKSVRRDRETLLSPPPDADLRVWVRWSHVIDAIRRAAGVKQNFPVAISEASWQFLIEISACQQDDFVSHRHRSDDAAWSMVLVERFLMTAGDDPVQMIEALLKPGMLVVQYGQWGAHANLATMFSGWPEFLLRHIAYVRTVLSGAAADQRVHAMGQMQRVKFDFSQLVDLVVSMATSSAKTVRETALSILEAHRAEAQPLLEQALADKDTSVRHEAVSALWRLFGDKSSATLRTHLESETSTRVKQTIEKLLAGAIVAAESSKIEEVLSLPPLVIDTGVVPLSEATKLDLKRFYEQSYAGWLKQYQENLKRWNEPNRPSWMTKPLEPLEIPAEAVGDAIAFLEGRDTTKDRAKHPGRYYAWYHANMKWTDPGVKLVHLVRFACWVGQLNLDENRFWWHAPQQMLESVRTQSPFGLRELDAVVASLPNGKPGMIATAYLKQNSGYSSFCDWEPAAIWPTFAEQPQILRETFETSNSGKDYQTRDYDLGTKRQNAFRVLAMFPQLPTEFVPLLWDIALGESKSDRPLAQAALARVPDKSPKVIVALNDGKQTIRQAAAEWLGKLGDVSTVEPLKEAFRKEKQEVVKGTMMAALDLLGADVNEFLDRKQLTKEATAGLAKKRPKGMEWVPLDQLPELHWVDSGKPVAKEIVEWWVVQSVAQKTPTCGPLLRRYLSLCRPAEAKALAKWVLSAWIAHDTRMLTHEEAAAKAKALADQQWAMYSQHQYWIDAYKGKKENLYQQHLTNFSNDCLGSAINEKGLLAIVAAAGDRECA